MSSEDQVWSEAIKDVSGGNSSQKQQELQADQWPTSSVGPWSSPQPSPDSQQAGNKPVTKHTVQQPPHQQQQQLQQKRQPNQGGSGDSGFHHQQDGRVSQSGMPVPRDAAMMYNEMYGDEDEEEEDSEGEYDEEMAFHEFEGFGDDYLGNGQDYGRHYAPSPQGNQPNNAAVQRSQPAQMSSPNKQQMSGGQISPMSPRHNVRPMHVASVPQQQRPVRPQGQPRPQFATPQQGMGPRQPPPQQQRLQHPQQQQQRQPPPANRPPQQQIQQKRPVPPQGPPRPQQSQQVRHPNPPRPVTNFPPRPPASMAGQPRPGGHGGQMVRAPGQVPGHRMPFSNQPVRPGVPGHRMSSPQSHQSQGNMGAQGQRLPQQNLSAPQGTQRVAGQPSPSSGNMSGQRLHSQQTNPSSQTGNQPVPHSGLGPMQGMGDEEEEDMYNEEEEEEYEEDMEEYYENYGNPEYGYHTSDSELSDEEAVMLDELAECDDDDQKAFLIRALQEKGVDQEDIDQALQGRGDPPNFLQPPASSGYQMYNKKNMAASQGVGNAGQQQQTASSGQQPARQGGEQTARQTGEQPVRQGGAQDSSSSQQQQQSGKPGGTQDNTASSQQQQAANTAPATSQQENTGQPRPTTQTQAVRKPVGVVSQGANQSAVVQRQTGPPKQPLPQQSTGGQMSLSPQRGPRPNQPRPPVATANQNPVMGRSPTSVQSPRPMGPQAPRQTIPQSQQGGFVRPPHNPNIYPNLRPRMVAHHVGPRPAIGFSPRGMQGPLGNPRLRLALESDTVPSEASLARLAVQYMQQSLDKEIMAKKGLPPSPALHGVRAQRPIRPAMNVQGSFVNTNFVPQNSPRTQPFPAYQPRHQLPPRVPAPGITPQQSSIPVANSMAQTGRPICSVVPFTSQDPRSPQPPAQNQKVGLPVLQQQLSQPSSSYMRARPITPQQVTPAPQTVNSVQGMAQAVQGQAVMPVNRPAVPASTALVPVQPAIAPGPVTQQFTSGQQVAAQGTGFQNQIEQGAKSDSFSLDKLSENQCIIRGSARGKQGLVTGMVYQIRSPLDNSLVFAVWNGEKFQDLSEEEMKARGVNNPPGSQQAAKANSNSAASNPAFSKTADSPFQAQFLQAVTAQQNQPPMEEDESSQEGETAPTDASPQQSSDTNQTTYVKPMPASGGINQQNIPEEEDDDDDTVFKKPYSENEDYFRVCKLCGYTSRNFKRCEGCKRIFQGEVKIHTRKKNQPSTGPGPSSVQQVDSTKRSGDSIGQVMANVNFYGRGRGRCVRGGINRSRGGGLHGRNGTGMQEFEEDSSDSDDPEGGQGDSPKDPQVRRRPARPKGKSAPPKKRSKKMDEPVTVMISSDEDEPSSTSNSLLGMPPSPANSTGSESGIFPVKAQPVNAFGRFRRELMQDEDGKCRLSKKLPQRSASFPGSLDRAGQEEEEEFDEDEEEDGDDPATYEVDIRSVRIGSMRTQPQGPLIFNLRGACFKVRSECTEESFEFEIMSQEMEHVKIFSGESQPVLFFFLTSECGEKLRSTFRMEQGNDEYFDPASTDMKQKMVVVIIECFTYTPQDTLRDTLSLWADMNNMEDSDFIEELSEEAANDLLIQSAPPVLNADVDRDMLKFKQRYIRQASDQDRMMMGRGSPTGSVDNEPDSTSSSPPEQKSHFEGISVRLLQYPFPPARGIPITTEDLFCLTEGEFLNDVIIDFYLQYLYVEKLSEEQKKRTHIFSSFFYKRLTQRDRQSDRTEEDGKKTIQERRHNRVKKWTKTVDLFSKDYIIVPINEHSHWYLAVICFPGLTSAEVVPFIPSSSHKADQPEEETNNDGQSSESGANDESGPSQESPPAKVGKGDNVQHLPTKQETGISKSTPSLKTVLGRPLDPKSLQENEDSTKFNLGQKQPCILMFDSLLGPSRNPNIRMLKEYLQCEWNAKKPEPRNILKIMRGSTPRVPQQSNYSDCGIYLLQYVESFFEDPIADFVIPMKGLNHWFPEELVHNKRRDIHELIMSLHVKFQEMQRNPQILDIKFDPTPREYFPLKGGPPYPGPPEGDLMGRPPNGPGCSRDDENSNSSMSAESGLKGEFTQSMQDGEETEDNFLGRDSERGGEGMDGQKEQGEAAKQNVEGKVDGDKQKKGQDREKVPEEKTVVKNSENDELKKKGSEEKQKKTESDKMKAKQDEKKEKVKKDEDGQMEMETTEDGESAVLKEEGKNVQMGKKEEEQIKESRQTDGEKEEPMDQQNEEMKETDKQTKTSTYREPDL